MKKNSKGFTLVELLATIVILGLLLVVAVPTVMNMVDNNRNKMYIDAAKKLVAQAEYQMRASSSKIEKPEGKGVIAISMVYLDSSDFDTTPTDGGEYIKEASFVVVKNTDTGLEYSVTVVEELEKGGYKGVELTLRSNLSKGNANKYVKIFDEDDLIFVEGGVIGEELSPDIINDKLGNDYCNSIENVYNKPDLSDSTAVKDTDDSPVIKSVTMSSASNKDYNTLQALLTLKATDDKTLQKDLKVYLSELSYDDALNKTPVTYGNDNQFTKYYDFTSKFPGGYDAGGTATVYVVVMDAAGNTAKKTITYQIHKNSPPVINTDSRKTYITKRATDKFNMPTARVFLDVSDDIDDRNSLLVCFSNTEKLCNNYKPYSNYFSSGNGTEFNFGGTPDGRKETLYIYVRDSSKKETEYALDYQIYDNKAPNVTSFIVESFSAPFIKNPKVEGGHLNAQIKVQATDDIAIENCRLRVRYEKTKGQMETKEFTYNEWKNKFLPIAFNGKYNGEIRNITVQVFDEYDAASEIKSLNYLLYTNKKPQIVTKVVKSDGVACDNASMCPIAIGGSLKVNTNMTINDDIDYSEVDLNNLLVCISKDKETCTKENQANFKKYSDVKSNGWKITLTPNDSNKPYDGSEKTLYYAVIDSYGEITSGEEKYKLYKNKPPAVVIDKEAGIKTELHPNINYDNTLDFQPININKAKVKFKVTDDFNIKNSKVKVCSTLNNREVCTEPKSGSATSLIFDINTDRYTGQNVAVKVLVEDHYGLVANDTSNYKLYDDLAPKIDSFTFESANNEISTNEIKISYGIRDPLDKLDVCIGEIPDNYASLSEKEMYNQCLKHAIYKKTGIDGNSVLKEAGNITTDWKYDGSLRKLYVIVKDSYNKYSYSKAVDYQIYRECMKPVDPLKVVYSYLPVDSNKIISASSCKGKCWRAEIQEIDEDKGILTNYLSYTYKVNTKFNDFLTKAPCDINVPEPEDCSFFKCYENKDGFYKAVGTKKRTGTYTHVTEDGQEHTHKSYYIIYNVKLNETKNQAVLVDSKQRTCADLYKEGYYDFASGNGYVETNDTEAEVKK